MRRLLDLIARRLGYVPAGLFNPVWQRVETRVETISSPLPADTTLNVSLFILAPLPGLVAWWYSGLQVEAQPKVSPRVELNAKRRPGAYVVDVSRPSPWGPTSIRSGMPPE